MTGHVPVASSRAADNILVIKLGALGDVILATPLLRHILEAHPHDRVTLLTTPEYAGLLAGFPRLQVVGFPRKGWVAAWQLTRWLLGHRFTVVYDLQGSLRSRLMTLISRAPVRAGRMPALAYTHAVPLDTDAVHAFERFNAVLLAAGIGTAAPEPWLPLQPAAAQAVASWLRDHQLQDRRLVLLHAGSSRRWPSKRWDESCFLGLAKALAARGLAVIWIGGADERDLNARLAGSVGTDATGVFTHDRLVALGGHAVCAITNDSGPMHVLSAAAGLPVYAFFGPTDWRRSHALGQQARVLRNPVSCSPCHLPECPPERRHECLRGLSPARVIARLEADGVV